MNLKSPITGTVLSLESVPDPVFSSYMLGPGLAIYPEVHDGTLTLHSPSQGKITSVRRHAVIVKGCLVHAGIDTYNSEALTALVSEGDVAEVGTPLISVDLEKLGELSSMVIVTFPQKGLHSWKQTAKPGTQVSVGEVLGSIA
ncbi:PTS sugar transporter subunit IIA [Flaviflexus massiliensis]|uniref:PTS sugar transporter subunit IIA n=1 Tax=Flaviflexus massiliensis TaxID=1522309 RepID=UPI00097D68BB|nr:PTS glucose transporter subunit IIA [Flaviflexus massiliensis]